MRQILGIVVMALLLGSCGAVKKRTTYAEPRTVEVPPSGPVSESEDATRQSGPSAPEVFTKASAVVETALSYAGVRYRYGGTTRKGMDCSGLLFVSFQEHEVPLPRVSSQMADTGQKVRLGNIRKGDLLFFNTKKRGRKINHVGLVVEVRGDDIRFIHSTTSRGVIVSSLREGYWNYAFVKATRVF